jgi:hypothetical protein
MATGAKIAAAGAVSPLERMLWLCCYGATYLPPAVGGSATSALRQSGLLRVAGTGDDGAPVDWDDCPRTVPVTVRGLLLDPTTNHIKGNKWWIQT